MTDKLDNQDAIIYRAAEIKKQIKTLETEYEMLETQVVARVRELSHGKDKYALEVGDLGRFSIIQKRKWEYSATLQALEIKLKEDKKIEEADGAAKVIEVKEYLQFRTNEPNAS